MAVSAEKGERRVIRVCSIGFYVGSSTGNIGKLQSGWEVKEGFPEEITLGKTRERQQVEKTPTRVCIKKEGFVQRPKTGHSWECLCHFEF